MKYDSKISFCILVIALIKIRLFSGEITIISAWSDVIQMLQFIRMVFRKDKCGIMLKVISRTFDIRISWGLTLVPIGR